MEKVRNHTNFPGGSGVTIGRTQLLCNQLGYVFSNEHAALRKDAVIEKNCNKDIMRHRDSLY